MRTRSPRGVYWSVLAAQRGTSLVVSVPPGMDGAFDRELQGVRLKFEVVADAFVTFASGASKSRWENVPRAPTPEKFAIMFGVDERALPVRLGRG